MEAIANDLATPRQADVANIDARSTDSAVLLPGFSEAEDAPSKSAVDGEADECHTCPSSPQLDSSIPSASQVVSENKYTSSEPGSEGVARANEAHASSEAEVDRGSVDSATPHAGGPSQNPDVSVLRPTENVAASEEGNSEHDSLDRELFYDDTGLDEDIAGWEKQLETENARDGQHEAPSADQAVKETGDQEVPAQETKIEREECSETTFSIPGDFKFTVPGLGTGRQDHRDEGASDGKDSLPSHAATAQKSPEKSIASQQQAPLARFTDLLSGAGIAAGEATFGFNASVSGPSPLSAPSQSSSQHDMFGNRTTFNFGARTDSSTATTVNGNEDTAFNFGSNVPSANNPTSSVTTSAPERRKKKSARTGHGSIDSAQKLQRQIAAAKEQANGLNPDTGEHFSDIEGKLVAVVDAALNSPSQNTRKWMVTAKMLILTASEQTDEAVEEYNELLIKWHALLRASTEATLTGFDHELRAPEYPWQGARRKNYIYAGASLWEEMYPHPQKLQRAQKCTTEPLQPSVPKQYQGTPAAPIYVQMRNARDQRVELEKQHFQRVYHLGQPSLELVSQIRAKKSEEEALRGQLNRFDGSSGAQNHS